MSIGGIEELSQLHNFNVFWRPVPGFAGSAYNIQSLKYIHDDKLTYVKYRVKYPELSTVDNFDKVWFN